jgi:DNA uptake protein ComE-like DNA-binding protein
MSEPTPAPRDSLPPDPPPTEPRPRIERFEALLIALLLGLIVAGNVVPRFLPEENLHPITVERGEQSKGLPPVDWLATPVPLEIPRKDVNQVDRAGLIALPGVGPAMADQILATRRQEEGFKRIADLDKVPGVGPKKLEILRRHLFVAGEEVASSTALAAVIPSATATRVMAAPLVAPTPSPAKVLNLNAASLEEIMDLPGIGKVYGERILARRAELGGFRSWKELDTIPGIGGKRLENIMRHATIE